MYNKVLVISDNSYLCKELIGIIKRKQYKGVNFTFSISPGSNTDAFRSLDMAINTYNLKDPKDLEYIIHHFNLVLSIHCKQLFPKILTERIKCINVHPGYNPLNRGWYPQVFSIINNLPVGATIHEIDEHLDHGNIIARSFVEKYNFDTSETLYNRILKKELDLLESNLDNIINENYQITEPENDGNIYLKKDFNNLLEIDLNEATTAGKLIDKLRALTHGNYRNAYFIDPDTNKKIHIGITLTPETDE